MQRPQRPHFTGLLRTDAHKHAGKYCAVRSRMNYFCIDCSMQVSTGKGLPAGPSGLLGAVEGFSYLSLLAAIVAFALKA